MVTMKAFGTMVMRYPRDMVVDMRMHFTRDEDPTTPSQRKRSPAIIPPVTFSGYTWGPQNSGLWYPPFTIMLQEASISASAAGQTGALLQIIRLEPGRQETTLHLVNLPATTLQRQIIFTSTSRQGRLSPPIVSPHEPVFVRLWTSSMHQNIVIQMTGEILT
jgi:hypothetical protein